MLTREMIEAEARRLGATKFGVGDLTLFDGEDPRRDPKMICPKAKCIIGFGTPVPKGLYKAMAEGASRLDLFFLVPTGRGRLIDDLVPSAAETDAVIGWAAGSAKHFYETYAGAVEIPDSFPGVYSRYINVACANDKGEE